MNHETHGNGNSNGTRIDLHVHFDVGGSTAPGALITALINSLSKQDSIMATLQQILDDVTANGTAIGSLSAFIDGLKQQIADALAGVNLPVAVQAEIDAVFTGVQANKAALATALAGNMTTPPVTTVPGTGLPVTTPPGTVIPGTGLPVTTVPGTTLPGTTLPGTTLPGTTLPVTTLPGVTPPVAGAATVVLTATPTPVAVAASVTLSAKVSGNPAPMGTVSFYDGAAWLADAALAAGTGTFAVTFATVGDHVITASYPQTTGTAIISSPVTVTVV
jgi:hypothetical protein